MSGPGNQTGFPSFVNAYPPPAVPGDFAGANIRANVIAGPGAFVASPLGVSVGVFAWANPNSGIASTYFQPNAAGGFVHKEQQAIITEFLGVSGVGIVGGDAVTVMDQGDFWGWFTSGGTAGQKVYADPVTGALTANATGNSVVGANTAASITAGVLTTTDADQSGSALAVGQIIAGAGIPAGTYILSADGTGSGTHLWNLANLDGTAIANVASEAIANYGVQETQFVLMQPVAADASFTASLAVPAAGTALGVLTVSAVADGTLEPGQWISATGLPGSANVQILEQLTSTEGGGALGGTGTYSTTNVYYTIGSTDTFAATQGKVGKISSWATNWGG